MMYEKRSEEQTTLNFLTSQKDHEMKEAIFNIQKGQGVDESKVIENFKLLHSLMKKDLQTIQESTEISRDGLGDNLPQ